jgi:KDO2-lipid IV(A) lauroyltransferase
MGASVVTFRTWTNTKRQIVIRFESVYPPKSDPEKLVEGIAKETETWISEHPEQWSWNYHGNFKV